MIPSDLRPLGIGEVLDRAVTLFVRRFAVLMLILAVVAVPLAIVQYATAPVTGDLVADVGRLLAVPPGHAAERRAILRKIGERNRIGAVSVGVLVIGAILGSLSVTACIIAVAQAYAGRLPSVREVYREALRRWLAQLVAIAAFGGFSFVTLFGVLIVTFFVALAIAALGALSKVAAAIVGTIVGVVAALVLILAFIFLYFAAQMAIVAIALEEPNPIRGIAHGLRRTFSPAILRRSALVGTIVFGVSFIGSLVLVSIGAALSALTHLSALNPVVTVIGGVALNALLTTFIVIYAIDVRVRREGYDLELATRQTSL